MAQGTLIQDSILNHLARIYGDSGARLINTRVRALIDQYSSRLGFAKENRPWTERDVLLITYGDQVRSEGEPPLRTLSKFLDAHVAEIISGVHILPFFPSSSDDGFSVIDYHQVDPALGSWDEIKQIGRRFDLMFDLVLNHISAQSDWFQGFLKDEPRYRDFFITVDEDRDLSQVIRPRALPLLTEFPAVSGNTRAWTTFSSDQIDLNYRNPDVLLDILEVMLSYVERGARYLRLDAIAYLWKEIGTPCIHLPQTHAVVKLMRAVLDQAAPTVRLVTETNVPHRDNVSYFGDGRDEAQMIYNFALPPLVLHTLLTGCAAKLTGWADTLSLPSDRVTFLNFLASHDGIGLVPARGILTEAEIMALVERTIERGGMVSYKQNADGSQSPYELNINYYDALAAPGEGNERRDVDRFMTAQSIMLSLVGIPGIYFHSLFGSRGDRAGAEATGIPRRINRQKLTRGEMESDLADVSSLRARVLARYTRLLGVRHSHPAFDPRGTQKILAGDSQVFALIRLAPGGRERVLCLHNVAGATVLYDAGVSAGEGWEDLISGAPCLTSANGTPRFELEPYQTVWATPLAGR